MIPGTPRRTVGYLTFYSVVAACAITPMVLLSGISGIFAAMTCCGLASALVAGLLFRVGVEPVGWRRLCYARNVALCVAFVFSVLDVTSVFCIAGSVGGLLG